MVFGVSLMLPADGVENAYAGVVMMDIGVVWGSHFCCCEEIKTKKNLGR